MNYHIFITVTFLYFIITLITKLFLSHRRTVILSYLSPIPLPQTPYKSTIPAPQPLKSTTQTYPSKNFKFPYKINKNPKSIQIIA